MNMIVTTRPLKIKYKKPQNPLKEFMNINPNTNSTAKEVVFVRYIGVPNSMELYIQDIIKMDEYFSSSQPFTPYLRLNKLDVITNKNDVDRLAEIWGNWQTIVDKCAHRLLYETPLGSKLNNDSLEWTKRLSFMQIISIYKENHPYSNPTLLKNFAIKFLHWIDIYLPKLITAETSSTSPKVVFIGEIKHHELLFLYFLSKLGCDICYMNPRGDIAGLYSLIKESSTLSQCNNLCLDGVPIPEFLPTENTIETPLLPIKSDVPHSKIHETAMISRNTLYTEEYTYEQLAALATSVVMIKTLDSDDNVLCFGSGVVLHSSGYILTNLHVVSGGEYFAVIYENETNEYITDHFVKYHQIYDLAIIKVERNCKPLPIKSGGQLVRGQKIVAIGSPLGLFNTVSDGIVSGFRDIRDMSMIQFTAPISNGSSGGALLDMYGRLVGLITAGFDNGQNLNLAVPAHLIYQFAQNFIEVPVK